MIAGTLHTEAKEHPDLTFLKKALPDHYSIVISDDNESIRCWSKIGIKKAIDSEDEEHWSYILQSFKDYFGERFSEVNHNVCFLHTDFTIHLKRKN